MKKLIKLLEKYNLPFLTGVRGDEFEWQRPISKKIRYIVFQINGVLIQVELMDKDWFIGTVSDDHCMYSDWVDIKNLIKYMVENA